jgi:valyl-tRNA synthetase
LQYILERRARQTGHEVLWLPGTDHEGFATQTVVERQLRKEEGQTRHDLGREAFLERVWTWKEKHGGIIIKQLKRLGCSCDWRRTRFTLDPMCARAVRTTFFDLFSKGLIYRGKRLVNWDAYLQTAVSDDEVFTETVDGGFWHFRYPVVDPKPGEPAYVVVATTRPETMLGDTAVAVHPDPANALSKALEQAEQRLAECAAKDRESIEVQIDGLKQRQVDLLPQLELLAAMKAATPKKVDIELALLVAIFELHKGSVPADKIAAIVQGHLKQLVPFYGEKHPVAG